MKEARKGKEVNEEIQALGQRYESVFGRTLFRIQALNSFGDVQEGDLGGYIEKEKNLSHDGNALVYNNAQVFDEARVWGNTKIFGNAYVGGNSWVFSDADILYIKGIGSTYPCITVCMTRDRKLFVMRQPFFGTLSEFETEVKRRMVTAKTRVSINFLQSW